MRFSKTQECKKYRIYLFLTSLIIIFVCILNMTKLVSPYYVPDEMGYWAAGAWMNGLDWSEVMSTGGYYAFGYGILLAPLFLLGDSLLMYRVAVLLNVVLLLGCYFLMIQICSRLFETISKIGILIICFATIMYSYHIVYSQLTQAEVILTFLFLLSVRILFWVSEKPRFLNCLLFALTIGAMFATHMRTLVIIICGSMCILFMFFKRKIKLRHVFSYSIFLGGMIFLTLVLKNRLIADEYTAQTGIVLSHNDFSGRVWVVELLFTLDGIKRLFLNFFSRIFYLGCSTFLIFYFGLYSICENLIIWVKKKFYYSSKIIINLYIVLSCLAGIAMGSAAMILPSRTDHVQYGRYYENLIALVIAVGIYKIITFGRDSKKIIIITAIHCIMCFVTLEVFRINPNLTEPLLLQNAGLAGFYSKYDASDDMIFTVIACILSLVGSYFLFYMLNRKKVIMKKIALLMLSTIWLLLAYKGLDENVYNRQQSYEKIGETAQEILAMNTEQDVYYLLPEEEKGGKFYDIYNLQFSLCRKKLKTVYEEQLETKKWRQGDFLIVHKEIGLSKEIIDLFELVFENTKFYVLEHK